VSAVKGSGSYKKLGDKYTQETVGKDIDQTSLKIINDYDRVLFAHNALMKYDFQNAIAAIMKEYNIERSRSEKYLILAREARRCVLANQGNIEEQIAEACDKFEYHRQEALKQGDIRAANQALAEKGKLLGLYVHKVEVEVTNKSFNLNWGTANIPNIQDAEFIEEEPINDKDDVEIEVPF
jgi:hypothetical protein